MSEQVASPDPDSLRWGDQGLIPAIVQDVATRRVLMLGYMNREALTRTVESGEVHFWSRSRDRLWRKGETSGNTLALVGLEADCDLDALLVEAVPAGPTCHTGHTSCFDAEEADIPDQGFAALEDLWATIASRAALRPAGSYTARLLENGPDLPARKVAEEAVEVLMAAKDHAAGVGGDRRVAEESADLVYHLLVLLAERGVAPAAVLDVLAERRRPAPSDPS